MNSSSSESHCPFSDSRKTVAHPSDQRRTPEDWFSCLPIDSRSRSVAIEEDARQAWRNSNRCIGRALWKSLETIDARSLEEPAEIFEALRAHLRRATNGGRIRSVMSCFREWHGPEEEIRIWNHQLLRYAGYQSPDGTILGDPMNLELTRIARALGWEPPREPGRFDFLPVLIQSGTRIEWFEWERDEVLEVRLRHPRYPFFESLGLRWYAVPAISDMNFMTESAVHPCAPFNGHYMGTEIGARDLADVSRYNQLPIVAEAMGLDTSSPRTLWKDHALLVLNEAVLWSFEQDGVRITDHHRASDDFLRFCRSEEGLGKSVNADWSWIVPPLSGSTTGVFHRSYDLGFELPNFLLQTPPWKTERGRELILSHATAPEMIHPS